MRLKRGADLLELFVRLPAIAKSQPAFGRIQMAAVFEGEFFHIVHWHPAALNPVSATGVQDGEIWHGRGGFSSLRRVMSQPEPAMIALGRLEVCGTAPAGPASLQKLRLRPAWMNMELRRSTSAVPAPKSWL